jgi:hypothetical protein
MNVESLTRIGVKFGHEAAILCKLSAVKPFDSFSIYETTLSILKESLHLHLPVELV